MYEGNFTCAAHKPKNETGRDIAVGGSGDSDGGGVGSRAHSRRDKGRLRSYHTSKSFYNSNDIVCCLYVALCSQCQRVMRRRRATTTIITRSSEDDNDDDDGVEFRRQSVCAMRVPNAYVMFATTRPNGITQDRIAIATTTTTTKRWDQPTTHTHTPYKCRKLLCNAIVCLAQPVCRCVTDSTAVFVLLSSQLNVECHARTPHF